jgi:hypothetical protein
MTNIIYTFSIENNSPLSMLSPHPPTPSPKREGE